MGDKKEVTSHHMGKETGYDLVNGEYSIAPLYCQQFDYLTNKEAGIKEMLNTVADHVAKDLEDIIKKKQEVWRKLSEDIGLDFKNKNWVYHNGIVKEFK